MWDNFGVVLESWDEFIRFRDALIGSMMPVKAN
jgi:hypothetical protein